MKVTRRFEQNLHIHHAYASYLLRRKTQARKVGGILLS